MLIQQKITKKKLIIIIIVKEKVWEVETEIYLVQKKITLRGGTKNGSV